MKHWTRHLVCSLAVTVATLSSSSVYAGFGDSNQDRAARWNELQKQIFGNKSTKTDDRAVKLDAPERAQDPALVPIAVTLADPKNVKALYLIVDENPSPVAAHFTFGPDIDPTTIKLRLRVNAYTDLHAVVEMKDGGLIQSTRYVKASGGCSAPMGISDAEAMKGMGDMKLKVAGDAAAGRPLETTLMVRHPNFNGMQMNQETRDYTPARYVQNISIRFNDKKVFALETDISLATNPVISFALLPDAAKGKLVVDVKDSQSGEWSKSFDVPAASD